MANSSKSQAPGFVRESRAKGGEPGLPAGAFRVGTEIAVRGLAAQNHQLLTTESVAPNVHQRPVEEQHVVRLRLAGRREQPENDCPGAGEEAAHQYVPFTPNMGRITGKPKDCFCRPVSGAGLPGMNGPESPEV